MPKRTRSYEAWQLEKLTNPKLASSFLTAALADSQEMFLVALRKVAQAREMASVAKEAGVQRETLYHALSEEGNPTLNTLRAVLSVLGMQLAIISKTAAIEPVMAGTANIIAASTGYSTEAVKSATLRASSPIWQSSTSYYRYTPGGFGTAVSDVLAPIKFEKLPTFVQEGSVGVYGRTN
ncbi:MAG TPA: addiction module antidote protein [Terracidiphilus sp.]|nr:addiction module antidote protein [Terracidiphilus sp.]